MSTSIVEVTGKNFARVLTGVIASLSTSRAKVQALIKFALADAKPDGDLGKLTRIMNGLIGVRTVPTKVITAYIKEHANVTFTTLKDGTMGFKTITGEKLTITLPTVSWYDWSGNEQAKPDMDLAAQIKSLVTRAKSAMSEHKMKGEEADNNKLVDSLAALVA